MKIAIKRLVRNEKGKVLIIVLILLVVGGLILVPLLGLMSTGLISGGVYERKTAELYAADAGVEDAIWKIQHGEAPTGGCNDTTRFYEISDVNGKHVAYNITKAANFTYCVVSTATGDGSGTTVEAYIESIPGDELNIFAGALASNGDITLGKNSTVNGDIYYCGDFDDGGDLGGNWTDKGCAPFPSQGQNEEFAQAFMDEADDGGTHNGDMNIDSGGTQNLGPIYITGNLNINQDVTINLEGIVYVKGNIYCEKELTINGTGSLVAEGDIYLQKLADYTVTGDSIILSLNGDITLKKSDPDDELSINALIYAPNGTITFDKDMTVFGGVVGESIQADKEGSFTFVPKTDWDFPGELPGSLYIKTYSIN